MKSLIFCILQRSKLYIFTNMRVFWLNFFCFFAEYISFWYVFLPSQRWFVVIWPSAQLQKHLNCKTPCKLPSNNTLYLSHWPSLFMSICVLIQQTLNRHTRQLFLTHKSNIIKRCIIILQISLNNLVSELIMTVTEAISLSDILYLMFPSQVWMSGVSLLYLQHEVSHWHFHFLFIRHHEAQNHHNHLIFVLFVILWSL